MPTSHYEMPKYGTDGGQLHGWLMEARQEGAAWLAAQRPATFWNSAQALIEEADSVVEASSVSNTVYPKAKRVARELVASLSSFRHEGEFKPAWDMKLYDMGHLLTDLDYNWQLQTQPWKAHRATLQNGVVKGTGYWYEEYNKDFWGPGRGDIELSYLDPSDVTFVQLPRDRNIQKAYMVIIRFELPINLAKRIYSKTNLGFAQALVPDNETPSWIAKGLQKVQQFLSPALRVAGRTRQTTSGSFPTVNIYHAYTMDGSINEGFEPIEMGTMGTNWKYTVPVLGAPMPTGINNPATGAEWTRPAKVEDCAMFPLRRLTIFSNTAIAYDGSSPWWHGDVPVARVWFNDWPWEALGGSLISDIRTMEQGIVSLMRGMEDSAAARLDPPAIYDDSIVSREWANAFNPRMAGVRGAAPLSQGSPITYPVQPGQYDVPAWIPAFMREQEDRMDYLTGVRDVVAMAKTKQIPGADTLEKLLEMAGPIQQDMVGALEEPLIQLGEWRKAYYFQFYTSARVIRVVGPDEFMPEEWTYEPDKLQAYFDNTPKGQDLVRRFGKENATSIMQTGAFQFSPNMLLNGAKPGTPQDMNKLLKRLISDFRYEVSQSGINEIHRMTTKLFYLQLMKEGFPISWWTFARIARIPNFGPPPEGTNTEMERWVAQQQMKIELQGELQQEMQQMQGAPPQGGEPGQPPNQIPALGQDQRGRPQTYRAAPRMVQKDHGTRATVTTA